MKDEATTAKRPQPVSSTLRRATQILEFISENQPARAPDIQKALSMTKGSVYHILASLEALDYVRKEASGYYLTFKLYAMGQTVPMALDFIEVAKPYMKRLADTERLNIYLSVPDKSKMVGIAHVKPPGPIQVANDFALTYELHSTASGKLWLASMSRDERLRMYETIPLEKITENTIVDIEELDKEIETVSARGYSCEIMEHSPYINGVAAALSNHRNDFVASLSAIGPTFVLNSENISRVGSIVAEYAREISSKLGASER